MRKLKKSIIPFLLVGTVAALASCEPEPTPGPGPEPTPEKVTVTFFTNFEKESDIAWMNDVVAKFEAENENIDIDRKQSGKYWQINEQLGQLINTPAQLPSMAVVYEDYVYDYMNTNPDAVLNIDSLMNDVQNGFGKNNGQTESNTTKEDVVQSFLDDGQSYGIEGTYSLPFERTTEVMYYNHDVFEENGYEVPTNWSEMIELARQMRVDYPEIFTADRTGNAGIGAIAPIGYDSVENMIITFCEMTGVPYSGNTDSNGDGHINKSEAALFNNDQFKQLLAVIKGWYDEGLITVDPTLIFAEPDDHYINEPFTGNEEFDIPMSSFMVLNSTTGASWCATDDFVPSVAPMPAMDANILTGGEVIAEHAKTMNQGGSIVFFDKGDVVNQAAWKFYKYMTNTENAATFAASYGSSPVRNSSFDEPAITDIMSKQDISNCVTGDGSINDSTAYMTANIYGIVNEYSENNQGFLAPVSTFSSEIRTTLGNIVTEVLLSKLTGQELTDFIDQTVTQAYEVI